MRLNKKTAVFVLPILALLLVMVAIALNITLSTQDSTERIVQIKKGDTAASIGQKLKAAGIVKSANSFRLLSKLRGADRALKPGTYTFGGKTNLWKSVSRLYEGQSNNIRITFPEGLSLYKTILRIEASGLASFDELYAAATDTALVHRLIGYPFSSLEGFLYPETYLFDVACTPDSIFSIMSRQFFVKLQKADLDLEINPDFYNKLILASIVEKEAGNADERGVIAGVFANRLRMGMALQSCPTVDYILEKKGIKKAVLSRSDTQIPSLYNTYQNPGLPPTPICNPQIESLLAAINPDKHSYLYFFADLKGANVLSHSFEEHLSKQRQRRS